MTSDTLSRLALVAQPLPEPASTPRPKAPRPESPYEAPTPEKRAFGARLREAREVSGMTLTEAAEAIGYSQPVQLSLMESGHRPMPLRVLIGCAKLYGTTTDFLCGLAPDSDPDPVTAVQRHVAARVIAEVRQLVGTFSVLSVETVRQLRPDSGRMARLAGTVIELAGVLEGIRAAHPFDDLVPGGARLVRLSDVALGLAREHLEQVARAQRVLARGGRAADTTTATPADDEAAVLGFGSDLLGPFVCGLAQDDLEAADGDEPA